MPTAAGAISMAPPPSQDELKKQVGYKAVDDYVRSGMVVGLGTGSTAYFAVERVGQKLKSGELKDIVAIPTSKRTREQAEGLGIPLATMDSHPVVDVAIDGADAVDPALNLIKGGGGAHFREKIVEASARTFVVIVDESKLFSGPGGLGRGSPCRWRSCLSATSTPPGRSRRCPHWLAPGPCCAGAPRPATSGTATSQP
ncbi:unnamed protein product [Prorocentrum cordatum]|uniref:ribose-5-phosphate isomerase n=1 Tax=Prorocentrum cordatum TaxID=2364126 RepID=A0ABN9XKW0_9DINO|nr:unnamed protein product [Polarella glacialis]